MCGVAGYIGQSKKPKLTYELITALFDYLEFRGTDAAGVWATEIGDGRVIYHKEPIRSSEFIQKDLWKSLKHIKTNLMLVHARATSIGGGHAKYNQNNHPFVTADKRIGMVHNGTLSEFQFLKDKYEIQSDTDSEVLLRMFEEGLEKSDDPDSMEARINGIEAIWSVIDEGAMAVGIGERVDAHTRCLFLFRNHKRPLWIADLRKLLGQIFFFSSPDIWYRAVSSSPKLQNMVAGIPDLIEVPIRQIWCLHIDKDNPTLSNKHQVERYELTITDSGKTWVAGERVNIPGSKTDLSVLSFLDDKDNMAYDEPGDVQDDVQEDKHPLASYDYHQKYWDEPKYEGLSVIDPPTNTNDHAEILLKIGEIATDIDEQTNNLLMQGTLSSADYQELIESLEQTKTDLEGTLRLLGK